MTEENEKSDKAVAVSIEPEKKDPSEKQKKGFAKHVLLPTTLSCIVLNEYIEELWEGVDYSALADELRSLVKPLKENNLDHAEAMLLGQAKVLDAMWNKLARLARKAAYGGDVSFKHLEAAMKVQRRCCATLEALAYMKKTNSFSIIQQQNVATNLQVNNAAPSDKGSAPAETQKTTIELLTDGSHDHETLDTGGTAAAAGTDSPVEAVGVIVRGEDD
ncbi:MAG: hypothetical protein HY052_07220 [Proteobacteria bacterium]|nr:hypothetical protein [Pseudomonadota bacterium]